MMSHDKTIRIHYHTVALAGNTYFFRDLLYMIHDNIKAHHVLEIAGFRELLCDRDNNRPRLCVYIGRHDHYLTIGFNCCFVPVS